VDKEGVKGSGLAFCLTRGNRQDLRPDPVRLLTSGKVALGKPEDESSERMPLSGGEPASPYLPPPSKRGEKHSAAPAQTGRHQGLVTLPTSEEKPQPESTFFVELIQGDVATIPAWSRNPQRRLAASVRACAKPASARDWPRTSWAFSLGWMRGAAAPGSAATRQAYTSRPLRRHASWLRFSGFR